MISRLDKSPRVGSSRLESPNVRTDQATDSAASRLSASAQRLLTQDAAHSDKTLGPISRPLLADLLQAGLLQILRAHQNAKLAAGLEVEKEGLCNRGHI